MKLTIDIDPDDLRILISEHLRELGYPEDIEISFKVVEGAKKGEDMHIAHVTVTAELSVLDEVGGDGT